VSAQLTQKRVCRMAPEPHKHAVESDRLHLSEVSDESVEVVTTRESVFILA